MTQRTPVILSADGKKHTPLESGDKLAVESIPLSPDTGNLLEARDNGLYYGVQAPADVANLYVDSDGGSDTNAGTKEAPLKTIAAALSKVRTDQSNTIHLRAGGRYMWPGSNVTGGASRIFNVWDDPYIDGDKVPTATPEKNSYNGYLRANLNRPVVYLDFVYNETIHVISNRYMFVAGGGSVTMNGIHFEARGHNEPGTGKESENYDSSWGWWESVAFFSGDASGAIQLLGCEFEMFTPPAETGQASTYPWRYIIEALTWGRGAPSVTFTSCSQVNAARGDSTLGTPLVQAAPANWQINVTDPGDSWSNDDGYAYLTRNLTTIPRDQITKDITKDSNGVPRNIMSNLVF